MTDGEGSTDQTKGPPVIHTEANVSTLFLYPRDNARNWAEIVEFYRRFPDWPYAVEMERLMRRLQEVGFVEAGLHGTTSMFELKLGPARDVLNNPHLHIQPVQPAGEFILLSYPDASESTWSIRVGHGELCERVERFLVKRARWFRSKPQE